MALQFDYIDHRTLQDAVQAVLDSLVEQISCAESADFECYKVYYSLLDSNENGETPEWSKKRNSPTVMDVVVLTNNKVVN